MGRRISISKLYYATRTDNGMGSVEYGSPTQIKKFVSIKTSDVVSSYTFYSDGGVEESNTKLTKIEGEIVLGDLPLELRQTLLGNTLSTELLKRNTKDKSANVVLMYSMLRSDGKYDFRALYNCNLSLGESEIATMEEEVEGATVTLTFTAVPNENGDLDAEATSGGETYTDENSFFKNVPGKEE